MHLTILDDSSENLSSYQQLLGHVFELELIQLPLQALDFLAKNRTDLIILDLHMPQMSGFEVYNKIRAYHSIPIIFLSADPSEEIMIKGLEMGADDFIRKPVSIKELIARVNNKIKNYQESQKNHSKITIKDFTLHLDLEAGEINNEKIQLTPIEYRLIHLFMTNPNKIFGRDEIINLLWPKLNSKDSKQKLDTHLSNLRRKTKPFSDQIKTIKFRGYVLRV